MPDRFDLRILTALQADSRISAEELAEQVGLSAPACYRRVRALRDTGAIERDVAIVAPATLGWSITMVVLVSLERDRGRIVDDMIRALKASPEVTELWYVTGEYDLVLHVAARDMPSYDEWTRETLHAAEHVRSFTTLVVMNHAKRAAALPPASAD